MTRLRFFPALLVLGLGFFQAPAMAADSAHVAPPDLAWHFEGPFGTFDAASMQRGLKVYKQVCAACHGMDHLYYRNITELGYTEDQAKNFAAEYTVTDGPNDDGEMFERPARPSDKFVAPYPNHSAAKAANNGALPPDLSMIAKARMNGPDYLYGILTGYKEPPAGTQLMAGQYWNQYMPGHVIAMPPPLSDGMVPYEDGSPETVEQYSKDVVNFLMWAAEPNLQERKRLGIQVIIFLAVFAGVMYAVKRKIWSKLH